MKVYKLEVMVIDFDGLGAGEIANVLESANYPNDCIHPSVVDIDSVDIGEWRDDHPLNNVRTQDAEFRILFGKEPA